MYAEHRCPFASRWPAPPAKLGLPQPGLSVEGRKNFHQITKRASGPKKRIARFHAKRCEGGTRSDAAYGTKISADAHICAF